jgi:hypothetical protein
MIAHFSDLVQGYWHLNINGKLNWRRFWQKCTIRAQKNKIAQTGILQQRQIKKEEKQENKTKNGNKISIIIPTQNIFNIISPKTFLQVRI